MDIFIFLKVGDIGFEIGKWFKLWCQVFLRSFEPTSVGVLFVVTDVSYDHPSASTTTHTTATTYDNVCRYRYRSTCANHDFVSSAPDHDDITHA